MTTHHVELRKVTKRFGAQKAVSQVDLVLKAGESVGLAGHNGAGKSTIMKLILGLITPTEGEVMLLGERTGSKAGGAASQPNRLPARNRCAAPFADRHRNAGFLCQT